jgi:hypothetical protein
MVFGNLRLMVENYVKVHISRERERLIVVWVSIAGAVIGSPDRGFQDQFIAVHDDSCASVY